MKKSIKLSLVAASIAALPYVSHAAGMGTLTVLSALGQPLRAEITVNAAPDELQSLTARVPEASAFKQAGVPFSPVLSDIRVSVERRGAGAVVRLSSDRPINEPFVDMMLELSWANGRLIREYTFLLDPAQASPGKPVSAVAEPAVRAAPQSPPPSRIASGAVVRTPASRPDTYRVKRGDTLNRIAEQTRPEGVTLDQMLVALFRANPAAFDGNMNRLRAGRILSVPSGDAALAIGSTEARREVVAQSADFADYRQRLAQAAVSRTPTAAPVDQLSSGRIAPKVSEAPNPVSESKDQVRVSKTDTAQAQAPAASGATGATSARLQALEEDLLARDNALKEANARLAELEKNILQLQQLIELKSKGMAELQAAAAPADTTPAAPVAAPAASVAAEPAADATPAGPAAEPQAAPQDAVEAPAEPKEAPPPVVAAAQPAAPDEPGLLDEVLANPLNLAAGGGLLALLLGWGLYRKRKASRPAGLSQGGVATELSIGGASVFGASGGQSVDTGSSIIQTDFSQSGMSSIDADEGVDPVAEADVYMAYGRDAQAEEILLDALKADPTRHAVQLKLLEIYAQRKNLKQFEHTAHELHSQTRGRGAEWQKAAAMGRKLDPENPLYAESNDTAEASEPAAGVAASVGASVAAAAAAVASAGDKDQAPSDRPGEGGVSLDFVKAGINPDNMGHTEMPTSHAELKETWAMPGDISQYASGEAGEKAVESQKAPSEGPAPMAGSEIDFNLDLGDAPVDDAPAADNAAAKAEAADDAAHISSALEFDLDIAEDELESDSDQLDKAARHLAQTVVESDPLAEIEAEEASLDDAGEIDFDLDVPDTDPERTEAMDLAATLAVAPVDALDNDDVAVVDLEKSSFDGTLLDFDFEPESSAGALPADATMLDLSSISLDLEAPEGADSDETGKAGVSDESESPELPVIEKPTAPAPASEDEGDAGLDLSLDDDEVAGADDEGVATKLELARAYEEMGDKDGARELLEEVLKEGNSAHQSEARSILERL